MYYDGFEGEEEVEITLVTDQSFSIHFWVGYKDDILSNPDLQGKGWTGFTKDYHQLEGAFSNDPTPDNYCDPQEYLLDIKQYQDVDFYRRRKPSCSSIDNHILGICYIC